MAPTVALMLGFAAALGGGLLIGVERERRMQAKAPRAFAGVRTFAMAALAGAGASALAQPLLVAAGALGIGALAAVAYWRQRDDDPGVTTELALLVTYLIGCIAIERPAMAAGGAVVVTLLLAGRGRMHSFVVETLSPGEARDGLLLAAAALIVLPLLPDAPLAWLGGAAPRRLWGLVVLFMGVQAAGHVALRLAGARLGLALSGLVSGFVSSTSTIAALGLRARATPALLAASVSGAMFSTVATVVMLAVVAVALCPPALPVLAWPLALALVAAVASALPGLRRRLADAPAASPTVPGRAFNPWAAIGFTALLAATTAVIALIDRRLGEGYADVAAALGGVADVHAAASSVLSLAAAGRMPLADVLLPVLLAFTANTAAKAVAAFVAGGRRYGLRVCAGLLATLVAAWLPMVVAAWRH